MTPVEVLTCALRTVERGWCYRASARTHDGTPVGPHHPEAVAWCVHGAINRNVDAHPSVLDAAEQAIIDYVKRPIQIWNDRCNQETVIRTLKAVITALEKS